MQNLTNLTICKGISNVDQIATEGLDVSTWDQFAWAGCAIGNYSTTSTGSSSYFPAIANRLGFVLKDAVGRVYCTYLTPGQSFSLRSKNIISIAPMLPNALQTGTNLYLRVVIAYIA